MISIVVPTRGRISTQLTVSNLPKVLHQAVTIVCPASERIWIQDRFPQTTVLAQPDPEMRIAEKRKWIVENIDHERIVMLDDDLRFAVRRTDEPTKFLKATNQQIMDAFV